MKKKGIKIHKLVPNNSTWRIFIEEIELKYLSLTAKGKVVN